MRSALLMMLAGALAAVAVPGQARWTPRWPTTAPSARQGAAVAADFGRLLMWGGDVSNSTTGTRYSDQLWAFDGVHWSLLTWTGTGPTARTNAAAAFDPFRGKLIVFGGRQFGFLSDETWEWDGSSWASSATVSRPSARHSAAMAFEVHNGRAILFGGVDSNGNVFDDTWAWNGVAWTRIVTPTTPLARRSAGLVYDSRRRRLVLFGGHTGGGRSGETWEFDGQDWSRIHTTTVPYGAGSWDHAMVYDQARDRVVLFGGMTSPPVPLGGTWEFDGSDWEQRWPASPPAPRINAAAAYMPSSRETVVFGGDSAQVLLGDTWKYQTDAMAAFQTVGGGCPGSFGTAGLSMPEPPWIGEQYVLEVARVPAGAATVIVAGFQTTSLPLDVLGAPGCVVTADPLATAVLSIAPSTGRPTLTLPIPAFAGLIGGTLHAQAVIYEPAGGGRFSVSPRGDAVFGAL